ncbi:MAG: F0F1 ATP synthase subunit B [Myxococcota bacterium]
MIGRILAVFLVAAAAAPALAAGDEHGTSHAELVWQAINLAILLGIIVYAARRPVKSFFAERRAQIENDLEESAEFLKQAETRYAEWQRKLVDLESELDQIRATARKRSHEERDHILAEARAAAERIKQDARAAIDQELRRAEGDLREEAADLAIELASRIVRDQIGDADRARLVDEFIAKVEAGAVGTGGNA